MGYGDFSQCYEQLFFRRYVLVIIIPYTFTFNVDIDSNDDNDNNPSDMVLLSQILRAESQRPPLSCIRVVIPGTHSYSLTSVSLTLPTATQI